MRTFAIIATASIIGTATATQNSFDQLCATGIQGRQKSWGYVCCPQECSDGSGEGCGGSGCSSRGGATECCGGNIKKAQKSCSTNAAPCVVTVADVARVAAEAAPTAAPVVVKKKVATTTTTTTKPDWANGAAAANQCWETISKCPKHPDTGLGKWTHQHKNIATESQCAAHARDLWDYCGSVEGAVMKTRFVTAGETFVEKISVCGDAVLTAQGTCSRTGCWRTVGSCPNHPTSSLIGKWDKAQGAERTEAQCHDTAIDVRNWCGTPNNDMVGSAFYDQSGLEVSKLVATCITGYEPRADSGVCQKVGCWSETSACPPRGSQATSPTFTNYATKERCAKAATWIGNWCKIDGPDTSVTAWYGMDGEENARESMTTSTSAYACDASRDFISGMAYAQTALTDYCRGGVCNANPKYGGANNDARALAYCERACTAKPASSCTGFFFQRHRNGHEICGFYSTALGAAASWNRAGAHAASAVCRSNTAAAAAKIAAEKAANAKIAAEKAAKAKVVAEKAAKAKVVAEKAAKVVAEKAVKAEVVRQEKAAKAEVIRQEAAAKAAVLRRGAAPELQAARKVLLGATTTVAPNTSQKNWNCNLDGCSPGSWCAADKQCKHHTTCHVEQTEISAGDRYSDTVCRWIANSGVPCVHIACQHTNEKLINVVHRKNESPEFKFHHCNHHDEGPDCKVRDSRLLLPAAPRCASLTRCSTPLLLLPPLLTEVPLPPRQPRDRARQQQPLDQRQREHRRRGRPRHALGRRPGVRAEDHRLPHGERRLRVARRRREGVGHQRHQGRDVGGEHDRPGQPRLRHP